MRHARPDEAGERPGTWGLASDAIADARRLGAALRDVVADGAATVACSTERKAIETAEALGLGGIHPDDRLREIDRPWYAVEQSFQDAVRHYLTGAPVAGWESLDDAAARFSSAIADLGDTHIVVSHGTIMSAWLSQQIHDLDAVSVWDELQMPDAWFVDLNNRTVHRIAAQDAQ